MSKTQMYESCLLYYLQMPCMVVRFILKQILAKVSFQNLRNVYCKQMGTISGQRFTDSKISGS